MSCTKSLFSMNQPPSSQDHIKAMNIILRAEREQNNKCFVNENNSNGNSIYFKSQV